VDQFDLLEARVVAGRCLTSNSDPTAIARAFWPSLATSEGPAACFQDEDRQLLNKIFSPYLSDRRQDGDLFNPPETCQAYVEKLRALVLQEEQVQEKRRELFLNPAFDPNDASSIFPSFWTGTIEVSDKDSQGRQQKVSHRNGFLQPFTGEQLSLKDLEACSCVFEKATENGTRFRIYRGSDFEARTIQEYGKQEVVGATFSLQTSGHTCATGPAIRAGEALVQATVYVEGAGAGGSGPGYFVVMETKQGSTITTEKLDCGEVTWSENPADLKLRRSFAKVLYSEAISDSGLTVGTMKEHRETLLRDAGGSSEAKRRHYAVNICELAARRPLAGRSTTGVGGQELHPTFEQGPY
jgi:hypothetical protein